MKKYLSRIACVLMTASLCLSGIAVPASAKVQQSGDDTGVYLYHGETNENDEVKLQSDVSYTKEFTKDGIKYGVAEDGKVWIIGYENDIAKSITIPYELDDGQTAYGIADNAFYNCSALESVAISEGIKRIGERAFDGCIKIKTVSIPSTVTVIEENAFRNMDSLETFNVAEGNSSYSSANIALVNTKENRLIQYPLNRKETEYTVPSGVERITYEAFATQKYLQKVVLADSTKVIESKAFSECSALVDIDLKNVQELWDDCFEECTELTSVTIPNTIVKISENVFRVCEKLKSITVADGAESGIHSSDGVLYGYNTEYVYNEETQSQDEITTKCLLTYPPASEMTEYTIETGTETICSNAFWHFKNLKKIVFNDELKRVSYSAFTGGEALEEVVFNDSLEEIDDYVFQSCTNLKEITLGSNVKTIGDSIFSYCTSLKKVNIPDKLQSMGQNVFIGCVALEEINVSAGNEVYSSADGVLLDKSGSKIIQYPVAKINSEYTVPSTVTEIENGAFSNSKNLTEFKVADGNTAYKAIDGVLFTADNELHTYPVANTAKTYTVPDGTVSIQQYAFLRSNLENVKFNEGLNSIGKAAFEFCVNLKECNLPSTLKTIGNLAFFRNDSITTVTIPASVTEIRNQAFDACDKLDYITFLRDTNLDDFIIGDFASNYSTALRYVYVPDGMQTTYKNMLAGKIYKGAMIVEGTKVSLDDTKKAITDLPPNITADNYDQVTNAKNAFVRLNNAEKETIADSDILKLENAVKVTNPDLTADKTVTADKDADNKDLLYNSIKTVGLNLASGAESGDVKLNITAEKPSEDEIARFDAEYTLDNNVMQPLSPIIIEMTISDDIKDKDLIVKHFGDDDTLKEKIKPVIDGNKLKFRIYSCSAFVLAENNDRPTLTVDKETGTAKVSVKENVSNAALIIAGYKNNELTGIKMLSKDFTVGNEESLPLDSIENTDRISAFFWNMDGNKLIPLCESK